MAVAAAGGSGRTQSWPRVPETVRRWHAAAAVAARTRCRARSVSRRSARSTDLCRELGQPRPPASTMSHSMPRPVSAATSAAGRLAFHDANLARHRCRDHPSSAGTSRRRIVRTTSRHAAARRSDEPQPSRRLLDHGDDRLRAKGSLVQRIASATAESAFSTKDDGQLAPPSTSQRHSSTSSAACSGSLRTNAADSRR